MSDKVTILGRADFIGQWSIAREIADSHGAQSGRFDGTALLTPQGDAGLIYDEEGRLGMGDGPALTATRRYLWAFGADGVTVTFADGRPFHTFLPSGTKGEAEHDCAPDLYRVTYDFSDWPRWQSRWRVIGPRKDYAMVTRYAPVTAVPDA